jgi:hypothetical protein
MAAHSSKCRGVRRIAQNLDRILKGGLLGHLGTDDIGHHEAAARFEHAPDLAENTPGISKWWIDGRVTTVSQLRSSNGSLVAFPSWNVTLEIATLAHRFQPTWHVRQGGAGALGYQEW